jgi:hypothetical protein
METTHRARELARVTGVTRSEEITASSLFVLTESQARDTIAFNIDRAITGWVDQFRGAVGPDERVALVASADMNELVRIQETLMGHFSHMLGARDVGTALGLAMAAQPDVAVIDADLELGSGVDAALTLPIFAPHTRVLVLTDDARRAGDVRIVGLDTLHRRVSDPRLLTWAEDLAA